MPAPRLFARKPISEPQPSGDDARSLRRVLGAGDLVMLAIGAVIGAGIFGAIGTAAAGQTGPSGEVIRYGAGPALISFLLLGAACALAALCYAELAAMIPQAGSAYAYAYATLGEVVAWIIGWDLILEYAVGNVAVAISWGDYFTTLTRGVGIDLPRLVDHRVSHRVTEFECRRSGTARDGATHCGRAARERASLRDCQGHHVASARRRESSTANNVMVVVKLLALGLFVAVGLMNIDAANYAPFAPNGFTGIHQGAAIVFFVHIGFDAVSTAAEETRNPQRNLPIGILGGLAVCTVVYVIVGAVLTGMVRVRSTRGRRPAGLMRSNWRDTPALAGWWRWARSSPCLRCSWCFSGQPRIFFAMARDGLLPAWAARVDRKTRIPYTTTLLTGVIVAVASLVGDAAETYDLTNIGTLFAFAIVLVCSYFGSPNRNAAAIPCALRVGRRPRDCCVPVCDGRPAAPGMGAFCRVAHPRCPLPGSTGIATRVCARMGVSGNHGIPGSRYGARLDCSTRRPRSQPQEHRR